MGESFTFMGEGNPTRMSMAVRMRWLHQTTEWGNHKNVDLASENSSYKFKWDDWCQYDLNFPR